MHTCTHETWVQEYTKAHLRKLVCVLLDKLPSRKKAPEKSHHETKVQGSIPPKKNAVDAQKSTIRVGGPYFENVAGFCDRLARETVRKKARSDIWREKETGTTDDAG